MKRIVFLIFLAMIACPGCASTMCGSEKTININSSPTGARFEIKSPHNYTVITGITPTNVTLQRGAGYFVAGDYSIKFHKAGYEDMKLNIQQGFETGWYFGGNLMLGGLPGWLFVDPLTGAMWDIKDKFVVLIPDPNYKLLSAKIRRPAKEKSH